MKNSLPALLGVFLLTAPQAASALQEGDFYYELDGGGAVITGYEGAGGTLVIPDTLGGVPVTSIGAEAFEDYTWLTAVTIPGSVTAIQDGAFCGCTGLTAITIPDGVTAIGEWVFDGCTGLAVITVGASNTVYSSESGVLFDKAKTGLIRCPEGKPGSVTIPGSVTDIWDWAFFRCTRLTAVTIPGGVTYIGEGAFSSCTGLTGLSIPYSVTVIGSEVFDGCEALTAITVHASNTVYSSEAGVLFDQAKNELIRYPPGKAGSYMIPYYVTAVASGAFADCAGLTSVDILLVNYIGTLVFRGCTGLASITVHASNTVYSSEAGVLFDQAKTELIRYPPGRAGSYTIPGGVNAIGAYAFDGCTGLTAVTIPDGVTSIGFSAFGDCPGLTTVVIPGTVTAIDEGTFVYCTGLTAVTIPDSVTSIGAWAFAGCSGLPQITIPGSVTAIGYYAFGECAGLSGVFFMGNPPATFDDVFSYSEKVIAFHLPEPDATGWGAEYAGRPTALWSAARSVTLDAQGGNVAPGSKVVALGGTYGNLPLPVRAGYAFVGWWTEPLEGGALVMPERAVADQATVTFYAAWAVAPTFAEALETDGLVWVTGGDAAWLTRIRVPRDGTVAAESGNIGHYQESWLQTAVTGPGTVDFRWKVSSEEECDWLRFFVDGTELARISGTNGGQQVSFEIGDGVHTLRWTYTKDDSEDRGSDRGWLDQVTWTPLAPPPPPPPDPLLDDPSGGGAAALSSPGTFDGFFYGEGEFNGNPATAVRGTLSVNVTKKEGALTAKAALQKGTLSFSTKAWTATEADGTTRATLKAQGGETLDLFVQQDRIWGTLEGGSVGEKLTLDGSRNRFADSRDSGAQALLNAFKGYYTVALPAYDSLALGAADAAPQGAGYLAVTVGAKGSAKIAGVLADGTKVTQSSRLILFDGSGPEACVPFFAPLYSKLGWAGGLLWLNPETRTVVTDRDLGWFIRWEKPGAGPDGFSLLLDACGGFYGTGAALASAYRFTAEVGDVFYYYGGGEAAEWVAAPEGVEVVAAGGRMTIAKGAKPRKVTEDGDTWYEYDEANPTSATLAFAAKTGLFKGKFNLYFDYYDATDRLVHKAVSVPYAGVLTPVRDEAFAELPAGLGHCLVPESDPALKAYKIKRSCPVWLEAE